jgi:hypothetical protein
MNHLESLQHYGTGLEDGKRQAKADKASNALMTLLFSFFFRVFSFIILFCPGIFCAYIILDKLRYNSGNGHGWKYVAAFGAIVYMMECLVFFLKGWFFSLKDKDNGLWVALWIICFLYCFALPALILHTFFYIFFKPATGHATDTLNIISWVLGVLIGIYIYSRYALQSDTAPRLMTWAYRMGKRC